MFHLNVVKAEDAVDPSVKGESERAHLKGSLACPTSIPREDTSASFENFFLYFYTCSEKLRHSSS